MFGRAKRMEIQRNKELASFGITIDGVRGTAGYGSFLACLAKAAIIFLVCSGTVTGFCDAFELEYNRTAVILFTAAAPAAAHPCSRGEAGSLEYRSAGDAVCL